ncbi:MAG: electron transport complex subunit E [Syntrophaceae bacterium]|nr:electron transport complex subunit E [Syntrophaceae bacterium]
MGIRFRFIDEIFKGISRENPTFRIVLGMCPSLAISTSVINAVGMGVAATFVLLGSNVMVSLIRNFTPSKVRIPVFIIIISTFVTIADLSLEAFTPDLHKALGIFIPLIVVNCIILARAEAFASREPVLYSIADALGMGAGFTLALMLISSIREALGNGTVLGYPVFGVNYDPAVVMILAPGAFLTIALLIGLMNYLGRKR